MLQEGGMGLEIHGGEGDGGVQDQEVGGCLGR